MPRRAHQAAPPPSFDRRRGQRRLVDVGGGANRLRLSKIVALQKPDGGVRGLVMSDAFRRVVACAPAQQYAGAFPRACAPLQYADSARASGARGHGARRAHHGAALTASAPLRPHRDLETLLSDLDSASRALLLSQAGSGGSVVLTTLPAREELTMPDDVAAASAAAIATPTAAVVAAVPLWRGT